MVTTGACPCCGHFLRVDDTYYRYKDNWWEVGCESCISEDYPEDAETCPMCGAVEPETIFRSGNDVVGCEECIERKVVIF